MTVALDGRSLTLEDLVAVARRDVQVELTSAARERMQHGRELLESAVEGGQRVYGFSTGAGALHRVTLDADEAHTFNRAMLQNCRVGHGPPAEREIVRGTLLRLANNLARGVTGVRPALADLVIRAINEDWPLTLRTIGSVGQADLAPMGDLTTDLIDTAGFELAGGEGMALIDNNSFSTAIATLAVADLERLADTLDVAGALDMEGFLANPSILSPVLTERPYSGLQASAARLRALLEGSWLWEPGVPRNLQDPLTYRCLPGLHGAFRDTLGFARGQLEIELNAAQSNPLVDLETGEVASVGAFEVLPLAQALDYLRIALAPVLTSANERMMKLLHTGFSGLRPGLSPDADQAGEGYTELGVAGQSIVAEARLLAAPVSFEMASVTQAEGIEDRMTMAPLAARRLSEMVKLGEMLVAMELVTASQAVDLRSGARLAAATQLAHRLIRKRVPTLAQGQPIPYSLTPVVDLVTSSALRSTELLKEPLG